MRRNVVRTVLFSIVALNFAVLFQNCSDFGVLGPATRASSADGFTAIRSNVALTAASGVPDYSNLDPNISPTLIFPTKESLLPLTTGSYSDVVPNTLDLAERAKLFLGGATSSLLENYDYAPAGPAVFHSQTYGLQFDGGREYCDGHPPCLENMQTGNWGNAALAMFLARRMSNYDNNDAAGTLTKEFRSTRNMVDFNASYRTQLRGSVPPLMFFDPSKEQAVTPTTLVMDALTEMYKVSGSNSAMRTAIDELALMHYRQLKHGDFNGRTFYYFVNQVDTTLYGDQGTIRTTQPFIQAKGFLVMQNWANLTGSPYARGTADLLRDYVLNYGSAFDPYVKDANDVLSALWRNPEPTTYLPETGQFVGQIHSYLGAILGVLSYAESVKTSNPAAYRAYVDFSKSVYEFAKRRARAGMVGNFGEVGTLGDMIRIGLKLNDMQEGLYYDEVDGWVRNQLAESQIDAAAASLIPSSPSGDQRFDNVGKRSVGMFFSDATHTFAIPLNRNFTYNIDGPSNAMRAMYEVWHDIIQFKGPFAQINFCLNRASRYIDIKSQIPYRGQVDLVTKSNLGPITTLGLRIPDWALGSRSTVTVKKNGVLLSGGGMSANSTWYWPTGNYLVIANLKPGSTYTVSFPMPISHAQVFELRTANDMWYEGSYAGPNSRETLITHDGLFRGNVLVDVSNRPGEGIPRFQRAALANLNPTATAPSMVVRRSPVAAE